MRENAILCSNCVKWNTLPAGQHRASVNELLSLDNEDLLSFYKNCIVFWEKERGWEYEKYSKMFSDCSVLEIGSGFGYDGIKYSKFVRKWTFCDIIPQNIDFVRRIAGHLGVRNAGFQLIKEVIDHNYDEIFDGFYAHGVLHHIPFEIARKEVANIDRFLKKDAKVVVLMYPYERWVLCGKPPFEKFGCMTDGEGTPWAEYYDPIKIQQLFGDQYQLVDSIYWGKDQAEFVNFELIKKAI